MLSLPLLSPYHISVCLLTLLIVLNANVIYVYQYVVIFYSCRFRISHVFIINRGCFLVLVCFHFFLFSSFNYNNMLSYPILWLLYQLPFTILLILMHNSVLLKSICCCFYVIVVFLHQIVVIFQFCGCFLISACGGSTINRLFSYPFFIILSPFTHVDMLSFFVLVVFNMLSFFLLLSFSRQNTLSFLIW